MYYFKFFIPFRFIECKIEEQFISHSFNLILREFEKEFKTKKEAEIKFNYFINIVGTANEIFFKIYEGSKEEHKEYLKSLIRLKAKLDNNLKANFEFLSVCDKFRCNEENERVFKGIIKNSVQISEFEFLKDLDLKGILDDGESWDIYKSGCEDIVYFKANFEFINYRYFKTAGFEFIFKEKPKSI
jgi:hypothetical protein